MGNNLSLMYKNKVIAGLARKHYLTFYGDYELPTEDVVAEHMADSRQHIIATLVSYASWLAAQDQEDELLTENMDDIVSSIKDLIEIFEYDVSVAAKNWLLSDIMDQYDDEGNILNDLEIVDDMEIDRREEEKKKKAECMKKLRECCLEQQEEKCQILKDDFEKDTLVGEKWEGDGQAPGNSYE